MKFKCIAFLLPLVLLMGGVLAQDTQRPITVSINPNGVTMAAGETKTFTATLQPDSLSGVKWTSTAGTIAGDGLTIRYTAPKIPGTYFLRATSIDQPRQDFLASVTIARPQQQLTADQLKAVAAKGCAPAANDGYRFCATQLENPKYRDLLVLGWTNAGYYFMRATEVSSGDNVLLSVHNGIWMEIDRMAGGNGFDPLSINSDSSFNRNSAGLITSDHPVFYYKTGGSSSYYIYANGKKVKILFNIKEDVYVQPNGDLYTFEGGFGTPLMFIYIPVNGKPSSIDFASFCEHKDDESVGITELNFGLRGVTIDCTVRNTAREKADIFSEYVIDAQKPQRVYNSELSLGQDKLSFIYSSQGQLLDGRLFPREVDWKYWFIGYSPKLGYLSSYDSSSHYILSDGLKNVYSLNDTYIVPSLDSLSSYDGELRGNALGFIDDTTIIIQGNGVYLLKPVK